MEYEVIKLFTQFGVAGLMGLLWVWERAHSRRREQQLTEAHHRLVERSNQMDVLCELVHRNTQAIERFEQTQNQLNRAIESLSEQMRRHAA